MGEPDSLVHGDTRFDYVMTECRDGFVRRMFTCASCGVLLYEVNTEAHADVHHAIAEHVASPRSSFDARCADKTYPDAHLRARGFKAWLIEQASAIRDELADKHGGVASCDIQRTMLERYPEKCANLEWRFLGGLWKKGGWTRTGEFREASHGRLSPVWRRTS